MRYLSQPQPWRVFNRLHTDLDRFLASQMEEDNVNQAAFSGGDWMPAVDIREESTHYLIHADVPGVDPSQIDVTLDNGILTIRGERQENHDESHEGYRRVERVRGSFTRRFNLPESVEAEKIVAKSKNGVLEITIPKSEQVLSRKITVDTETA